MWERTLSQKLVRLFCEQKVVDESKADAYVYGYDPEFEDDDVDGSVDEDDNEPV